MKKTQISKAMRFMQKASSLLGRSNCPMYTSFSANLNRYVDMIEGTMRNEPEGDLVYVSYESEQTIIQKRIKGVQ